MFSTKLRYPHLELPDHDAEDRINGMCILSYVWKEFLERLPTYFFNQISNYVTIYIYCRG